MVAAERATVGDGGGEASQSLVLSGVVTALHQAPLGIAIFDREMRYLAASGQYLTDQGLPGDMPLVGRLHYDVFPEVPARWRDLHVRALKDGVELSHDADPYVRPDGRTEWIRWSLKPWRTEGGAIAGLVLYTEVVTPKVEARMRLEAAEARYRAVFNQMAMGVARVAPDGRFLEMNDRYCAITGYGREDLLQLRFHDITHPDDLTTDTTNTDALLAGAVQTFSIEKRYLTKAERSVWVDLTVALVRTEAGEPDYFISIIADITYRKDSEVEQQLYQDQLRLMINELNHRVKNTLATVQSMAAQTMRGETDLGVAYGKFESRLMSLSEVHGILTREHWHGAELTEVVERALRPFLGDGRERVRIEGPQVWLQPGPALALALVFHELATNAVKYGALSNAGGRVALHWRLDADGERLELTWAESDGPPVSPPTRKGFGTRLIERGLRGDLRGAASLRYEPSGLVCAMEARLSEPPALLNPFGEI